MKRAFCAMALMASVSVVGCKSNSGNAGIPKSESVADVSTPAPAPISNYQPAPQPAAQPVVYDAPQTSSGSMTTMAGGSYTVKKGDTLYSIARARYGDGKQWTKLTAANPGLQPQSLKVGQTITIP